MGINLFLVFARQLSSNTLKKSRSTEYFKVYVKSFVTVQSYATSCEFLRPIELIFLLLLCQPLKFCKQYCTEQRPIRNHNWRQEYFKHWFELTNAKIVSAKRMPLANSQNTELNTRNFNKLQRSRSVNNGGTMPAIYKAHIYFTNYRSCLIQPGL